MDLDTLVPVPALKTGCGRGFGMAACPALGLLVTSNCKDNTLSVFALPRSSGAGAAGAGASLALVCTLGGASSRAPMRFKFLDGNYSGWMAFTGPATSRLLLLTDAGHDAVHVIDVAGRVHVGYVAAPGTIAGPRGVAARGSLVAVSAWKKVDSGDHVVHVFEGSGAMWTAVRVVGGGFGGPGRAAGQLCWPHGLRITSDGTELAVADAGNDRVTVFRVEDGSFVRHVATGLRAPYDVEESEGGWLVACWGSNTIEFVGGDVGGGGVGRARLGKWGVGDGEFIDPSTLALVPGLGLVVREHYNMRVQFFVVDLTSRYVPAGSNPLSRECCHSCGGHIVCRYDSVQEISRHDSGGPWHRAAPGAGAGAGASARAGGDARHLSSWPLPASPGSIVAVRAPPPVPPPRPTIMQGWRVIMIVCPGGEGPPASYTPAPSVGRGGGGSAGPGDGAGEGRGGGSDKGSGGGGSGRGAGGLGPHGYGSYREGTPRFRQWRAFVAGASSYTRHGVKPLPPCCLNDANDMEDLLKGKGYHVTKTLDPTKVRGFLGWEKRAEV